MQTIEAKFKIVTPMFLGGVDHRADTIRPPSVKGALRFWWRAVHWAAFLVKNNGNEVNALKNLHHDEARVFGLAADDKTGGQGIFLLRVTTDEIKIIDDPFPINNSIGYLLGMGLAKYDRDSKGSVFQRNAISSGNFTLSIIFRPNSTPEDIASVFKAIEIFGSLGALGSRSRHGFGSVQLIKMDCDIEGLAWCATADANSYLQSLQKIIPKGNQPPPPFSAFSSHAKIVNCGSNANAITLLGNVGMQQQLYRSYGNNGKVGKYDSERKFIRDHDLILNVTQGNNVNEAPKRAVFGLPHNYKFSNNAKTDVNYNNGKDARRASPLLLHVHEMPNNSYIAIHTLLKAQFLPIGSTISMVGQRGSNQPKHRPVNVPANVDWAVIDTYLKRFNQT